MSRAKSCASCQRIKAKCEHAGDGTPCHRCARLGLDASCDPPLKKHSDAANALSTVGATYAVRALPKPGAATSKRAAAAQLAKAARAAAAAPAASRAAAPSAKGSNGLALAAAAEQPNAKRRRLQQPPPANGDYRAVDWQKPPPPPHPAPARRGAPPALAMGPLQSHAIVHGVSADYSFSGGVPKGLLKFWLLYYSGTGNIMLLTRAVTLGAICGYASKDPYGSDSFGTVSPRCVRAKCAGCSLLSTQPPRIPVCLFLSFAIAFAVPLWFYPDLFFCCCCALLFFWATVSAVGCPLVVRGLVHVFAYVLLVFCTWAATS
jgi:hypothetical protein